MAYDVGDVVRVSNTFTSILGVASDPTAVFVKYKTPAGTTTTLTYGVDVALVKDSTGVYHVDIDITTSGVWWARFYSTGTYKAAAEDYFVVRNSQF